MVIPRWIVHSLLDNSLFYPLYFKSINNIQRTTNIHTYHTFWSFLKNEFDENYDLEETIDILDAAENDAPIIKYVNQIIFRAVKERASDIHIEKYQDLCLFKFRVDGRLRIFISDNSRFGRNGWDTPDWEVLKAQYNSELNMLIHSEFNFFTDGMKALVDREFKEGNGVFQKYLNIKYSNNVLN